MILILFFVLCAHFTNAFNPYPKFESLKVLGNDYGEPFYFTPFIENNQTAEARNLSRVLPLLKNIESYAGYFTVEKKYNSNLFVWFFPAENNKENAPVVVWLQGGPGATSLYGLFTENGPFFLNSKDKLKERNHRWTKMANIIYIDNPVGTGLSFTNHEDGYSKNITHVGRNLYEAVKQFFTVFPEYRTNNFFVFGESYGGKYAPALAFAVHEDNKSGMDKINLQGIGIGDGLCDPINMMGYGNYLYEIGLIDSNMKRNFNRMQKEIISAINRKEFHKAFNLFDSLLNGDFTPYKSLFYNATGYSVYFNFLQTKYDFSGGSLSKFLKKDYVRKAIHVGNRPFNDGKIVEKHLINDFMDSVKPWFELLIENYRVLVFNGQMDIIVAYPLTVNFLQKLDWSGAGEYKRAERKIWRVNNEVAGYTKTVNGFTEVLVRNAGHMVAVNQPHWAFVLVKRFLHNEKF